MTGSASLSSPLCTWLFTACMSVTCAKESAHALSPPSYNSSRRRKAKAAALPMKCCCCSSSSSIRGTVHSSPSNDNSNNKSMLSCKGLMSSCLADEPCSRYYASGGLLRRQLSPPATSGQAMAVAVQPTKEVETEKKPLTRQRRVVVTGMGVVSPLGHDPGVFYNNLLQGVSGVTRIEAFDCAQFPTRIAGEIKSFSTDGWVAPKLSKRMDKFMLYMLTAGKKALADGGITEDVMGELNKTKCGVLIGSAMGGMKVFNDAIEALRISYKKMNPFCVPFATTNMGSAMLAMDLGWMGPNYSISTACATSNFCILNAANHIIRGEAVSISCSIHFQQQKCGMLKDVMLCGGSDAAIIPIGVFFFFFSFLELYLSYDWGVLWHAEHFLRGMMIQQELHGLGTRSFGSEFSPLKVFCNKQNRDGFVMGEGAGVLLLEELEHAKKRGANIYAEFLGGSFTCDAYHMTEPRPGGNVPL
ncbi:hypothetical protein POTOM_057119 [Populus tomentosa]|uniref:beta-ketoacyl-[acyl-carrier-protein] synthase I n=1 Tax=Populus tomentosa TaxID=118781 RepID=A0A8X7Y0A3_POPTO|nr:hypothetical protein POTOM_057119 [Populus tomentosa]